MWEMIITEINRTTRDFAQAFAHMLPRFLVMLIIVFIGWLVAYLLKNILRSTLRLVKFDRLSENAGAAELLKKAALPSSTELLGRLVFWVTWLDSFWLALTVLVFSTSKITSRASSCFFRGCSLRCCCCSSVCWRRVSFPALLCLQPLTRTCPRLGY